MQKQAEEGVAKSLNYIYILLNNAANWVDIVMSICPTAWLSVLELES